jgi:hypothetical protein
MSADKAKALGKKPLARVVSMSAVNERPQVLLVGQRRSLPEPPQGLRVLLV